MKRIFVILILFGFAYNSYAQNRTRNPSKAYRYKKHRHMDYGRNETAMNWVGTVGFGAGNENYINMPKFGGIAQLPLFKNKTREFRNGLYPFSIYAGGDVSVMVLFAGSFSASAKGGVLIGPLSLEHSIARTVTVTPDGDVAYKMTSLNPKAGLAIGPIWAKAGPSIPLTDVYFEDWIEVDAIPFNFELSYIINWGD